MGQDHIELLGSGPHIYSFHSIPTPNIPQAQAFLAN